MTDQQHREPLARAMRPADAGRKQALRRTGGLSFAPLTLAANWSRRPQASTCSMCPTAPARRPSPTCHWPLRTCAAAPVADWP